MNIKRITAITFIAASALLSGCATVTRGTTQNFSVTSEPSAAEVRFSTGMTCETPCSLEMKRRSGFSGKVSKEGHEDHNFTVGSGPSMGGGVAFAGNLVLGGVVGLVIDSASGAIYDLDTNHIHAILKSAVIPVMTERQKEIAAEIARKKGMTAEQIEAERIALAQSYGVEIVPVQRTADRIDGENYYIEKSHWDSFTKRQQEIADDVYYVYIFPDRS